MLQISDVFMYFLFFKVWISSQPCDRLEATVSPKNIPKNEFRMCPKFSMVGSDVLPIESLSLFRETFFVRFSRVTNSHHPKPSTNLHLHFAVVAVDEGLTGLEGIFF